MDKKLSGVRELPHNDKTAYLWRDERLYEYSYKHYQPSEEVVDLLSPIRKFPDPAM